MNHTLKAYLVILTGLLMSFLVSILLYSTAPAQEVGFHWASDQSGEEFVSNYVLFRENTHMWRQIERVCPGCYKVQEYIRPTAWSWWAVGVDLNPGYNLVFWPESSYAIVTDEDGTEYRSVEWVLSKNHGKVFYTSATGQGQLLTDSFTKNPYGHAVVLFRFDWRNPPSRIVNCRIVGVKPRRLFE